MPRGLCSDSYSLVESVLWPGVDGACVVGPMRDSLWSSARIYGIVFVLEIESGVTKEGNGTCGRRDNPCSRTGSESEPEKWAWD